MRLWLITGDIFPGTASVPNLKTIIGMGEERPPDVVVIAFRSRGVVCLVYFKNPEHHLEFLVYTENLSEVTRANDYFILRADSERVQRLLEECLGDFEIKEYDFRI
jgi:hypothetical protein